MVDIFFPLVNFLINNVDYIIVVGFLAINLAIGLYYSTQVKTINDYALGRRNFSTLALATTLIATWIGGSSLTIKVSETYKGGLYYIITGIVDPLTFLIVAYIFVPRMSEFLGKLSIAEAMGSLYGKNVRIVTAISGILGTIGYIAIQFKVAAGLFNYFLGIDGLYATLLSAFVVICYSSYRGIQAVTFTDMFQFLTFGVFIPILTLLIWGTINDFKNVLNTLSTSPLFDYNEVFNYHRPGFLSWLGIMIFFLIPGFDPAVFQRISMARNVYQIRKSLIIAAFLAILIGMMLYWIGILLLSSNEPLDPKQLVEYVLSHYSYPGLIGFTIVGILAMVMSTADSYINSSSVLIAHDILKPLGIRIAKKRELLFSRIAAVLLGLIAIIPALSTRSLREVIILTFSFYMPIVTVPFILSVLGFRSTSKSVLIGMCGGFLTVIIFHILDLGIDSVIPGICINLLLLFSSHYLLKQNGGWIGIKDHGEFQHIKNENKKKWNTYVKNIKTFNFLTFCRGNVPKNEITYSLFGLFCIVSIYSSMFTIDMKVRTEYIGIIKLIYHSVLIASTIFLTYPIWPESFKNRDFISVSWLIGLFYILIFSSGLQVIISNFGQLQSMIFMLNLVVLAILIRWQIALLLSILGIIASIQFFKLYIGVDSLPGSMGNTQFKIIYSLLLITATLIAFFKPRQEEQERTEKKVNHLGESLLFQNEELTKLQDMKNEFLRNLPHEINTPVTGITSMAQGLHAAYDKLTKKQILSYLDDIAKSSIRFDSVTRNITDLSKLSSLTYELNKSDVNLSDLVYERLDLCKKLYLENKELEFITNIEDNIIANIDKYYIQQTLDNLIINSINYSSEGVVTITLKKTGQKIEFSIKDEGIGIPQEELRDIFGAFVVSSRTRSPAEGRGIGLALCHKVINVHGGEITAESDGQKGASFAFILPA